MNYENLFHVLLASFVSYLLLTMDLASFLSGYNRHDWECMGHEPVREQILVLYYCTMQRYRSRKVYLEQK